MAFRHADEAGFAAEPEPELPDPEACAGPLAALPAWLGRSEGVSDDRLATGLRFLFSGERCGFAYRVRDGAMPAIGERYGLLDRRCGTEPVADRDDGSVLDRTVFMRWDVSPLSFRPPAGGEPARLGREAFVAMLAGALGRCRSPVCLESALHGLGHLVGATGGASGAAIRAWLARGVDLPPETRAYAMAAAEGTIP